MQVVSCLNFIQSSSIFALFIKNGCRLAKSYTTWRKKTSSLLKVEHHLNGQLSIIGLAVGTFYNKNMNFTIKYGCFHVFPVNCPITNTWTCPCDYPSLRQLLRLAWGWETWKKVEAHHCPLLSVCISICIYLYFELCEKLRVYIMSYWFILYLFWKFECLIGTRND